MPHADVLPLLVLGAVVAGFVQGLSGFAFGMVSMSFWVWGIEPRLAAVMAVFGGLTGQLVAAFSVRRELRLALLLPFIGGALLGIPIGVALLPHLDPLLFKAVFGLLLISWCPTMLFAARLPRVELGGPWADGAVGLTGGVLGGIGGFTGVLPSLWCTLRGLDKDVQRTIVQNFNLSALAVTFAVYAGTGAVTRDMLPLFAVVAPAMLLPTLLGTRVYIGLSELAFRRIVLSLLSASGVAMLAASLPRLLQRWG